MNTAKDRTHETRQQSSYTLPRALEKAKISYQKSVVQNANTFHKQNRTYSCLPATTAKLEVFQKTSQKSNTDNLKRYTLHKENAFVFG